MCCQDDKEAPGRIEVAVELESAADLCLTASGKSGTIVCVIEAKTGAKLADHQNPEEEAFCSDENKPKGYGSCLIARHGKTASQLRYVVLGHRGEPLQLPNNPLGTQPPIQVLQHPWSKVADITLQSDLVKDLFKTFAALGISAFTMKDLKPISLTPADIAGAANAQAILVAVLEELRIPKGKQRFESSYSGPNSFWIGYWIRPSAKKGLSGFYSRLVTTSCVTKGGNVAWIGYGAVGDENVAPRREVYVFVDRPGTAKKVAARLEKLQWSAAKTVNCETEIPPYVMLTETLPGKLSDLDFFLQALRQAVGG